MGKRILQGALALCLFGLVAAKVAEPMFFYDPIHIVSSDTGYMSIRSNCVTETTNSGAGTHVIDDVFPARSRALGVTCRVDTVLAGTGLTTWSLGDGTDADLYGASLAKTAGTVVDESTYTASPLTQAWATSAADLTMTAAAGQFDSGAVTCCGYYYEFTAPSS